MMFYINISCFMFMLSMILILIMIKFLLLKMIMFIEFNLFIMNSSSYSLMLFIDHYSLLFMSVVLMISSMVILYSIEYMMEDYNKIRFIFLLFLFVISMLMMILGQNLLMILLGWDGLGLISYCLVIYYNNWSSFSAGMITILTNRLGDVGLLISIGLMSNLGDWNYMINNINLLLMLIMIVLAGFTKSAQIPFSTWLPAAMAAPTPISSLVHSSTLVTAGIYLLIRFFYLIEINSILKSLLIYFSLMTMFFSGIIACVENDFKKIIALSTLSQLGLMMFTLFLGLEYISFFHLITHAMFKSLLFMCAGLILHSMSNNQDIRYMGVMNNNYFFTMTLFNISSMALCGFPFLSGFYSKDLILEMSILMNINIFMLLMFYISIMFTVIYSFRLIYYLMKNYMKYYSPYYLFGDNKLMNISMLIMFMFSIFGGLIYSWLIFNSLNMIYLEFIYFLMLYFLLLMSLIMGLLMNFKFKFHYLVLWYLYCSLMWNLIFMIMIISKLLLKFSLYFIFYSEDGWGINYFIDFFKIYMMMMFNMDIMVFNIITKILLIYIFIIMIFLMF